MYATKSCANSQSHSSHRMSPSSPSSKRKRQNLNDKNCEENEIRRRNKKKVESFAKNAETVERTRATEKLYLCQNY